MFWLFTHSFSSTNDVQNFTNTLDTIRGCSKGILDTFQEVNISVLKVFMIYSVISFNDIDFYLLDNLRLLWQYHQHSVNTHLSILAHTKDVGTLLWQNIKTIKKGFKWLYLLTKMAWAAKINANTNETKKRIFILTVYQIYW